MRPDNSTEEVHGSSLIKQESSRVSKSTIRVFTLPGARVFMGGYDLLIIGVVVLFIPFNTTNSIPP
ncbi:MAG: hypothetical protein JRN56_02480 [Nitrososphaerota archaeon]|jgi:hypothetical protein|nr:hypothetical protein [Nitrososphaerota archaeon]MDG6904020.1 hypothetical protein [Nitrososphaerota archaeon]MDG6911652.1 hypothetical protein [Nitrososphaerota archaeon]MDG6940555.1 hypothetical protein [Nitrososphaerota archaeon]MDG6960865.1 hypothetical protein [Nitrososphaerota archaeon]